MKFPVAIVAAVMVWSSARYLPPYFLELQKLALAEQRIQMEAARQVAIIKELRAAQAQSQTKMSRETAIEQQKRFY